jgi:hypothetical protein
MNYRPRMARPFTQVEDLKVSEARKNLVRYLLRDLYVNSDNPAPDIHLDDDDRLLILSWKHESEVLGLIVNEDGLHMAIHKDSRNPEATSKAVGNCLDDVASFLHSHLAQFNKATEQHNLHRAFQG